MTCTKNPNRTSAQFAVIRAGMAGVVCAAFSVVVLGLPANASQPNTNTPVNCLALPGGGGGCPNPPTQPGGLDHFLCYQVATDQFSPPLVNLHDQFGSYQGVQPLPATAGAPSDNQLCNPVIKTLSNAAGGLVGPQYPVSNPQAHLYCFSDNTGTTPTVQVSVQNQFGTGTLSVGKSTRLCLPSWKYDPNQDPASGLASGSVAPTAWTDPANLNLNHFQCYQVVPPSAVGGGFSNKPASVQLQDQFGVYQTVTIGAPKELCAPVIKQVVTASGAPVGGPSAINTDGLQGAHLLCFAVQVGGTRNVLVGNQFSATPSSPVPNSVPVGVTFADQLCLPSFKTVIPPPGTPEVASVVLFPFAGALLGGAWFLVHRRRRSLVA